MSLYLKYRPKDFFSLSGQDFIKNTLQKAVLDKKTVGAYLFCGPRGTGKTSTARILAKAINCKNNIDGNPCNNCNICNDINDESLIDVIEIDAASHTGVDNIRELIEKAQFRPTNVDFKIYIIDEVHMLSKGAFNALLKILEEPPVHVKFILATTETHKVPETIISRCQKYDFKRISNNDIKNRLLYISKEENIKIDDESLDYITNYSAGGLRNAISLFEQLISDFEIKYDYIIKSLGIISNDKLELFYQKLLNKDKTIIDDFDNLIEKGKNIKLFFKELFFYIKNETIKNINDKEILISNIQILDSIDETFSKTKNSIDENTSFLIGILKIISGIDKENKNIQEIVKKIDKKEVKKEEISITNEEINNIFGIENNSNNFEDFSINTNNKSFDKELFIKNLKDIGAKGGLTMGLRAADIILNNNILTIIFKTQFALNQINNTENQALIKQSLINMGLSNISINLKV